MASGGRGLALRRRLAVTEIRMAFFALVWFDNCADEVIIARWMRVRTASRGLQADSMNHGLVSLP